MTPTDNKTDDMELLSQIESDPGSFGITRESCIDPDDYLILPSHPSHNYKLTDPNQKTLHLPNAFVRSLILDSNMSRNSFLVFLFLVSQIRAADTCFNAILFSLRELGTIIGVSLAGGSQSKSFLKDIDYLFRASMRLRNMKNPNKHYELLQFGLYAKSTNTVQLQLNQKFETAFLDCRKQKIVVKFGYLRRLSSPRSILLYMIFASIADGHYTLKYDIHDLAEMLAPGADCSETKEILIRATYEIDLRTNISAKIHFSKQPLGINVATLQSHWKSKFEMSCSNISVDAPRQALHPPTKKEMRAAVVSAEPLIGKEGSLTG